MIILVGYPLYRIWFLFVRKKIRINHPLVPSVIAFWHRDIFMAISIVRTMYVPEKTVALVSPSLDGDYLAWILRRLGYKVIRGSASNKPVQALWESIRHLRDGYSLMITPDGPKGPSKKIKPGLAVLSTVSQKPVQMIRFNYSGCWRLKSWDRFILPKPFSECSVTFSPVLYPVQIESHQDNDTALKHMEDFLNGLTPDSAME